MNFRFQWGNTGVQKFFQYSRSHVKILGIRRVTVSMSHLETHKYYASPYEIQSSVCGVTQSSFLGILLTSSLCSQCASKRSDVLHQAEHINPLQHVAAQPRLGQWPVFTSNKKK